MGIQRKRYPSLSQETESSRLGGHYGIFTNPEYKRIRKPQDVHDWVYYSTPNCDAYYLEFVSDPMGLRT